jgi:hypothetical protein
MDVAAQSVELGNRNRALASSRVSQGRGKLRSAVQGIRALARFDLRVLAHDFEAFRSGKASKGLALRFQTQARTALFCRRNSMVSNDWSNHDDTLFTLSTNITTILIIDKPFGPYAENWRSPQRELV